MKKVTLFIIGLAFSLGVFATEEAPKKIETSETASRIPRNWTGSQRTS